MRKEFYVRTLIKVSRLGGEKEGKGGGNRGSEQPNGFSRSLSKEKGREGN